MVEINSRGCSCEAETAADGARGPRAVLQHPLLVGGPGDARGGALLVVSLLAIRGQTPLLASGMKLTAPGKLSRARSRLYRSQIFQVNMRLKALAEIYTMHSFALL